MTKLLCILVVSICFGTLACTAKTPTSTASLGEGFAIYLTAQNVPVSQMPALSHVDLAENPVVSVSDVVSYDWGTHEIKLTSAAMKRLDALQVPTSGTSFVICVDRQPVYWGAFWAGYSSQSFDGITIMLKPPMSMQENTIQIGQGYPSSSFYKGEDPRSDSLIMESLQRAGKIALPSPEPR